LFVCIPAQCTWGPLPCKTVNTATYLKHHPFLYLIWSLSLECVEVAPPLCSSLNLFPLSWPSSLGQLLNSSPYQPTTCTSKAFEYHTISSKANDEFPSLTDNYDQIFNLEKACSKVSRIDQLLVKETQLMTISCIHNFSCPA